MVRVRRAKYCPTFDFPRRDAVDALVVTDFVENLSDRKPLQCAAATRSKIIPVERSKRLEF